jgi:hypothetical protein
MLVAGMAVPAVHAAPGAIPPVIELSALDGTNGFTLPGIDKYDGSGISVSGAGDVNGDGIDDFIIGAYLARPNNQVWAGESYIVFGRTTGFPAVFELSRLLPGAGGDGTEGFVVKGIRADDTAGASVSRAGDVNGDGIADLAIGAPSADANGLVEAGEVYVIFGRTTGFPAALELRTLLPQAGGDGSEGFVIRGIGSGDRAGKVSDGGDVNGDGVDDLFIGSHAGPNGNFLAGEGYVVFGRTTGFPATFDLRTLHPLAGGDGSAGFIIQGIDTSDYAARSLSGAGDVNGDGVADLIIGAAHADPNDKELAGETYVVFGRTTGFPAIIRLHSLFPQAGGDGSQGFVLRGIDASDESGESVSGAGDVNGDGLADVVIGAFRADPADRFDGGESYVVYGRTSGFPPVFELSSLTVAGGGDGSEGFVIQGMAPVGGLGSSVSDAGDVNGDGIDDVILGAQYAHPDHRHFAGEAYVLFGRATAFPAIVDLRSLDPRGGGDGSAGFIMPGIANNDNAGRSVSGAGDVNGDGFTDVIIGARSADPDGKVGAGESYVVFGGPSGVAERQAPRR